MSIILLRLRVRIDWCKWVCDEDELYHFEVFYGATIIVHYYVCGSEILTIESGQTI
jgi:hypothetical protein